MELNHPKYYISEFKNIFLATLGSGQVSLPNFQQKVSSLQCKIARNHYKNAIRQNPNLTNLPTTKLFSL
jgi:hypothetical protein